MKQSRACDDVAAVAHVADNSRDASAETQCRRFEVLHRKATNGV